MDGAPDDRRRSRRAALGAALAISCVHAAGGLDRLAMTALVEPLRADLWLRDAALGQLATVFTLAAAAAALSFPSLARRLRPSRLAALGGLVAGLATGLAGATVGFYTVLAARAAGGYGRGLRLAALPAGDAHPRPHAGLASGLLLVAGASWTATGLLERAVGWRGTLFAAGSLSAIAALASLLGGAAPAPAPDAPSWRALSRAPGGEAGPAGAGGIAGAWRRIAPSRADRLLFAAAALRAGAVAALLFWGPTWLERTRDVPRPFAALQTGAVALMAAFLAGFVATHLPGALAARGTGPGRAVRLAVALPSLGAALAGFAALLAFSPAVYLAGMVVALGLALAAGIRPAGGALAGIAVLVLAEAPAPALVGALSDLTSLNRALALAPLALFASGLVELKVARDAVSAAGAATAPAADPRGTP